MNVSRPLAALSLLGLMATGHCQATPLPPTAAFGKSIPGISMTFDRIPVSDFVMAYYTQIQKSPFVIDPTAAKSDAVFTMSLERIPPAQVKSMFMEAMRSAGFLVQRRGGVDFIRLREDGEKPIADQVFIYHPRFRDANYLSDLIGGLFATGHFVQNRPAPRSDGAPKASNDRGDSPLSLQSRPTDTLVFNGTEEEVAKLKGYLASLDTPAKQVRVRAVVYEVSGSSNEGFNLGAVIRSASQKLSLHIGAAGAAVAGSSVFRLQSTSLDVLAELFATDSRFNVVTRPDVLAADGQLTRFQSGENVPVLGQVSYDNKGNPLQSVDYKPSGIVIEARPQIRGEVVSLQLNQEVSNFVPTKTGVNSSPTLMTRNLTTTFDAKPGDVYVIGGLKTQKETQDRSFFPFTSWAVSNAKQLSSSEIVVLVQVEDATPI
ncbi:type II secretion system protein GspD [Chromobacterium paludis]|uniref:Type II/III secretion system secretin-like domain-containing protein n=1 Tax=Chromobacterium paludis TaxID=2605945 RepID=A0A5C1DIT2_9NEIS|nr:hypothetical protein [Chromobacterium paludis]QEL56463.1 hypothetical protein FYK34_13275 [Chromobacterium paludis]